MIPARATLAGSRLHLTTTPELEPGRELPWRLLPLNGSLPAGCRLVLDADGNPELQVEIGRGESATAGSSVAEACHLLDLDVALPRSTKSEDEAGELGPWIQMLEEDGWSTKQLPGRGQGLAFEAQGVRQFVELQPASGGLRLAVEIVRDDRISPIAREAIATLLLRGARSLPIVRAAGLSDERSDSARFEALVGGEPSMPAVEPAVGGLVLASTLFRREAQALMHDPLALAYLTTTTQGRLKWDSNQEPALTCSK